MPPRVALLVLLLPAAIRSADAPVPVKKEPVVELDPIRVHEKPIISFAVDIVVHAEPVNRTVTRIFITHVLPRTDAQRAGLQAGDEIVKLDGQAVKGMDSVVAAGSPLGRLLLGREPGDELKLELFTRRTQQATLRAARQENDWVAFAADVVAYADPETKQVTKAFLGHVRPGSDAALAGLRNGDEILKLGDQPVQGLDSALTATSPLGRLLLNRQPGESLNFEVVTLRTQEVSLKAQRGLPFTMR